ncbi:MAG: zinc-ribbon domain-containing protein [Lachnospiraceae bacterium]|nr:zinc-ribbon domain-containing protein [Lachnospiraceae bacterium]
MKCVKCGAEMPDNGKFCLECGTKLEVEEPVKRIVLKCSICNGQLESEEGKQNLICPYCGSRELILDSDSVAIQRIKSEAFKDVELARMKNETDKEKRREEKEMREAYKKSKFAKFTGICFFIAVGLTIFGFSTNHILSAMTALIMAALFAASWLMGMQIIPEKIKYLHVILAVAGIGMILLFIFGTGSCSPKKLEKINWPTSGLASEVPTPNMKYGSIGYNSEDMFRADMDEVDKDDFVEYVDMCKNAGFIVAAKEGDTDYKAFNADGVKVEISFYSIGEKANIHVYKSISNSEYVWPNTEIGKMVPKPRSNFGEIDSESTSHIYAKIAKTSGEDYKEYISECEKRGFDVNYSKHDNYFYAEHEAGYSISINMEENDIMVISLNKIEEENVAEETAFDENNTDEVIESAPDEEYPFAGVYTTSESETIVLCNNGLAYYYYNPEFFNSEEPWKYENGEVSFYLPRLHCTIKAEVSGEDISELKFVSDSANWSSTKFKRTAMSPEEYISKKISAYDNDLEVNDDGSFKARVGGMSFIIPSNYRNNQDLSQNNTPELALCIDTNADDLYVSGILMLSIDVDFSKDQFNSDNAEKIVKEYVAGFYKNYSLSNPKEKEYGGKKSITFNTDGYYNKNFGQLSGMSFSGKVTLINNDNSNRLIVISFDESKNSNYSNEDGYNSILESAEILESGNSGDESTTKNNNSSELDKDGVSKELKDFLDSYEKFMDDYVEFMKKYISNSDNILSMAADYMKMLEELEEFEKKADKYKTDNMSDADLKYYTKVMLRIEEKMLEAYL